MKTFKLFAVCLCLMFVVSGCSPFTQNAIDEHPALVQLAVKAAVSRVLTEKPAWINETYDISAGAIKLVQASEEVDLQGLETYVIEKINWEKLTPEEEQLLILLISAVRQEVEMYLEKQGVAPDKEQLVYVSQVMLWINETAHFYQIKTSS